MTKHSLFFVALVIGTAACSDPPEPPTPAQAVFEVPRPGVPVSEFYALPFPSDIRRDDAGHPMVDDYPTPALLIGRYATAMAKLDGFGTNAAIFTRFTAPIDVESLPVDAAASQTETASVYLVDVDPASPARGTRHPLRFRFQDRKGFTIGPNWLSALPYPGFPLRERTTYALVVTSRLTSYGTPVTPSGDWPAVAATTAPTDPALARAHDRYAPLWTWLDEPGGDERADVVSAAVFTTQDVSSLLGLLHDRVAGMPAPIARDVARQPVKLVPFALYNGVFDAPNFQTGEVPYRVTGGDIVLSPTDGLPEVQVTEPLRFAVTVPHGPPPPTGWPVVIYAHGTGGGYQSFIGDGTAVRLAEAGLACISIDQVLHGPRNPGGDPELDFFNFQNPDAGRNNAIQGAADNYSVVRLLETLTIDETDPKPFTIRFDPARVSFFGHSQGGLTGPPFLAYEPKVRTAVLSGAGGLLYFALLHKTEPVDITSLVAGIILDEPLDEFNPVLALLQTWVERSDTINYGPLLVRQPPRALPPMDIYQSMGFIDHFTPLPDIEALAVSIGGDLVAPTLAPIDGLTMRGRSVATAPVTSNLDGHTAVVVQYQATQSDGHFVVFDTAAGRRQSIKFLETYVETGRATLVPAQ